MDGLETGKTLRMEKIAPLVTAGLFISGYKSLMLVRRIWNIPSAAVDTDDAKPVARIGLGGALKSSTEKGSRLGRRLGWGSFWAMVTVVVFGWIRWGLMAFGLDFSNGVAGLDFTLMFLAGTAVVVSHLLIFVCDYLTGGDAGPSAWALAIFWGGVFVLPFFLGVITLFL